MSTNFLPGSSPLIDLFVKFSVLPHQHYPVIVHLVEDCLFRKSARCVRKDKGENCVKINLSNKMLTTV